MVHLRTDIIGYVGGRGVTETSNGLVSCQGVVNALEHGMIDQDNVKLKHKKNLFIVIINNVFIYV